MTLRIRLLSAFTLCLTACAGTHEHATAIRPAQPIDVPSIVRPGGETPEWWFRAGAAAAHASGAGREPARNIILFIGDGMSLPTVAAARILEGQRRGEPGEENRLSFETFPNTALSRTYNTDSQTPDSAGTMTALITGVKTRKGVISVGQQPARGDCRASQGQELIGALALAEAAGLATGIVTTTRFTHATPAAAFAQVADREWEDDSDLPAEARAAGCRDIARQFIEFEAGDGIDVALGGGRGEFMPSSQVDPVTSQRRGKRQDGRDLVAEWRVRHPDGRYVWTEAQLQALDPAVTGKLFGLFAADHLAYEHDRLEHPTGEPGLAAMTRAAIATLQNERRGFFLVVEAGRIDHAHHGGNAHRALLETIAFSDAIRAALETTSATETLIVVTADHSHTLTFAGYPRRGNPILGKVVGASSEDEVVTADALDRLGLPFTTLAYANGPGYSGASDRQPEGAKRWEHRATRIEPASGRPDLRPVDTEDPDHLQEAPIPLRSETHGGDDVGVWATGPGSAAVRGSVEQNVIFHWLIQSQPAIVEQLCATGGCENGVPVKLPGKHSLRRQAR